MAPGPWRQIDEPLHPYPGMAPLLPAQGIGNPRDGSEYHQFFGKHAAVERQGGWEHPPIQHEFHQIKNRTENGHGSCIDLNRTSARTMNPGGPIRTFLVSLLGAATLTAGLFLVRQHQREADAEAQRQVPAGERVARNISLEKLRELGL